MSELEKNKLLIAIETMKIIGIASLKHYEKVLEEETYDDRGECENTVGYCTGSIETYDECIKLIKASTTKEKV